MIDPLPAWRNGILLRTGPLIRHNAQAMAEHWAYHPHPPRLGCSARERSSSSTTGRPARRARQAVLAAFPDQLREDVTLAAEAAASTRANMCTGPRAWSAIPAPGPRQPEPRGARDRAGRDPARRGPDAVAHLPRRAERGLALLHAAGPRAVVRSRRRCGRRSTWRRARSSASSTTRSRRSRSRSRASGRSSRAGPTPSASRS